jgi:threonine dehydrogenase-like Zn-dependent dehydrogenase
MRALTWQGDRRVSVETVPDPRIEQPDDVIIRVTSSGICGSDLHLYGVLGPFLAAGDILGHETMGIVEEVGSTVRRLAVGDRVVVPFVIACGECFMCERGMSSQCERTGSGEADGAALYGYTELYGSVPGGQAEWMRVRHADVNAIKVGTDLPDDRYLFLSDILPTAWQGVVYADPLARGTVAIIGLGPVGQLAARVAAYRGQRVLAIELEPERRAMAERHGIETHDADEDAVAWLRDATHGRGPDSVVDAVGMEAHGEVVAAFAQNAAGLLPGPVAKKVVNTMGIDRMSALYLAIDAVRRGGTVSISGVYGGAIDPLPLRTMFDKQLTLRMGQCNVHRWVIDLLPIAEADDDPLGLADLVTHRVPLEQAPELYKTFRDKEDGCVKVVLEPGRAA